MLLPLGGGCYGYGTLNKKGRFVVDIGAGLVKEQGLKDALENVKGKKKDVKDVAEKLKMEMEHMRSSMDKIGLELQEIQSAAQKEKENDDDSIMVE